jgi:hypothetical protein
MYITSERLQALVALALGLISAGVGWRALAGSVRATGTRRPRAIVALSVGFVGVILAAVHLMRSGPIGTGGGRLGAVVALIVALIAALLGGLALARSRRHS